MHIDDPETGEKDPAAQLEQADDSTAPNADEKDPEPQSLHADDESAPTELENEPAGH